MKRDSRLSKLLSVALTLALVVSLNVPFSAWADEGGTSGGGDDLGSAAGAQPAGDNGQGGTNAGDGADDGAGGDASGSLGGSNGVTSPSGNDGEGDDPDAGISPQAEDAVAKIGDTGYATLQTALDAAAETPNATVVLQGDVEGDPLFVKKGDFTLDLNGHQVTSETYQDLTGVINVAGGNLTIEDNSSSGAGEVLGMNFAVVVKSGKLVVNGGKYGARDDANRGYWVNAWNEPLYVGGGKGVINGGLFVDGSIEFFLQSGWASSGSLTVNGGRFDSLPYFVTGGAEIWAPSGDGYLAAYLTFEDFTEANPEVFEYDSSSKTLKMVEDYAATIKNPGDMGGAFFNGDVTLDLNGHTWTLSNSNLIVLNDDSEVTLKDSSVGGAGKITNATQAVIEIMGTLNMEGGTLESNAIPASNNTVLMDGNSTLNMTGGTISGHTGIAVQSETGGTKGTTQRINISGGVISTRSSNISLNSRASASCVITGGVFSSDIALYLAEGYSASKNEDGTYVVTSDYAASLADANGGVSTFDTLQKAIDAAKLGDMVTLLKDVTESITVPEGANVTLNLNGFTLTNGEDNAANNKATIYNKGTLTVTDSSSGPGTVDNVSHARAAVYNEAGATCALEKVSLTRSKENGQSASDNGGNSYYTVLNHGTMTLRDGVSVSQGEDREGRYSSMIENGWQNGNNKPAGAAESVMTIKGGTFTGGLNTVKNDDYGVLEITGGEFRNSSQATIMNWNKTTVKGGTFQSESRVVVNGYSDGTMDQGKLAIAGGTFVSGVGAPVIEQIEYASSIGEVTVSGGTFTAGEGATQIVKTVGSSDDEKVSISGGTFNLEIPESQCAEGFVPVKKEDGNYGVVKGSYVATVTSVDGGVKDYATLQDAVEAVKPGEKITLLQNVTLPDNTPLRVVDKGTAESPITINLNGKNLSGFNSNGNKKATREDMGILQIRSSIVDLVDTFEGEKGCIVNYDTAAKSSAVLVMPAASKGNSRLTVSDGVVAENKSSESSAYGLLVYGASGLLTEVILNDATIKSADDVFDACSYASVVVNGGSYSTSKSNASSVYRESNSTIVVNGGVFTDDKFLTWSAYLGTDAGFLASKNSEGRWIAEVKDAAPDDYVAHVVNKDKDIYLKSGDLYLLSELGLFLGEIKVAKSASLTYPEGKFFGVENRIVPKVSLVLSNDVVLSGNVPMALGDVDVKGTGRVQQGTFTPLSAAYKMESNGENGLYSCRLVNPIAKITYASGNVAFFSDAASVVKQIGASGVSKVELFQDLETATTISLTYSDVALDLGGHSYTYTGASGAFLVSNNKQLVVQNGTLKSQGNVAVQVGNTGLKPIGNLVVNKDAKIEGTVLVWRGQIDAYGEIDGSNSLAKVAIAGNGTANNGTVINVYEGAKVTGPSDDTAIYHPQSGVLNIVGGTISGGTGIYMKAGELNITGGTITAVGEKVDYAYNGNGANPTGDAVVLDACGYLGGAPIVKSFTGATVTSKKANAVACYYYAGTDAANPNVNIADKNFITGGTFSNDVTEYCETGFAASKTNEDSNAWTIGEAKHDVVLYSALEGGSVTSVATLTGGGNYTYGAFATVTATPYSGYEFVGWYKGVKNADGSIDYGSGSSLSQVASYTFTVTEDTTLVAVFKATKMVTLRMGGADFSVNGNRQNSGFTREYKVGTEITVAYLGSQKFYRWKNGSDKTVSTGKSYTFTIVSDTDLTAVYDASGYESGSIFVEFVSAFDQVMQADMWYANEGVSDHALPQGPSKMGYRFKWWTLDPTTGIEASATDILGMTEGKNGDRVTLYPVYEATGNKYTVTVRYPSDSSLSDAVYVDQAEGGILTLTAHETLDGKAFSYWSDAAENGDILSYNRDYFVRVDRDKTLYPIYGADVTNPEPTIAMTGVTAEEEANRKTLSFSVARDVPEGYTVVEHGVIYGASADFGGEQGPDLMTVDAANTRKLVSTDEARRGSYVAHILVGSYADVSVFARGYLVVRNDETGEISYHYTRIASGVYSDMVS